jgi:two-component system response regulator YesN
MNCVIVADAKDGEEGLEKIIEFSPDVVITDIKMPKMNGMEMLSKANSKVKFKSIILTSYMEFDFAKKAIELKAYGYLLKPIDENKIRELMKELHEEIFIHKEEAYIIEHTKNRKNNFDIETYLQYENNENEYVVKSICKIKDSYSEKISVESISEELSISPSYLSRKFKDTTGQTFLDFLNKYRVGQAVKLLQTGRYRVYEISEMVGFSDYKHFCTVFRRYTQMSPTGFTKRRK